MPTDEELIAICKSTPLESRFEQIGCLLSLVIAVALLVVFKPWHHFNVGTVIFGSVLFVPTFTAAMIYLVNVPYRLRTFSARKELDRRYPMSTKAGLPRALSALRRAHQDAEWIVLVHQSYLPHGGIQYVNVRVTASGQATIQGIQGPFAWHFRGTPARYEGACSPDVNQLLAHLLPAALECGNETISSRVRDGSPSEMLGWNRTANRTFTLSCNSAAMHAHELEKPNVKLLLLLANDVPLNLDEPRPC